MYGVILESDKKQLNEIIDENNINRIINNQVNRFESYDNYNLISFNWLKIDNKQEETDTVTLIHTKDKIYFVSKTEEDKEVLELFIKENNLEHKDLSSFFSSILKTDINEMANLEEEITDMEDLLILEDKMDYTTDIIRFRKELLKLKRYYEELDDIFAGVLENENKIISKDGLKSFTLLDKRTDRLLARIVNLRDYITQLREAYQAQIDIEQNRIMKFFTVVTTIVLPLTLITGWYGMNLKMPELEWERGYLYVIIISVFIVSFFIFYFKRKKWF